MTRWTVSSEVNLWLVLAGLAFVLGGCGVAGALLADGQTGPPLGFAAFCYIGYVGLLYWARKTYRQEQANRTRPPGDSFGGSVVRTHVCAFLFGFGVYLAAGALWQWVDSIDYLLAGLFAMGISALVAFWPDVQEARQLRRTGRPPK